MHYTIAFALRTELDADAVEELALELLQEIRTHLAAGEEANLERIDARN